MNNTTNPTIILVSNINNTITIDNPRKRDARIGNCDGTRRSGGGFKLDVQPNGHAELSIIPNATMSLRYYCQCHPQTMLGDISITNATLTMTNATTPMTNQTQ